MAVRQVVTERQMQAAKLLVDGWSATKALLAVGYGKYTARNFGSLLRQSWGLREALRIEQENRRYSFTVSPKPPRKYARRKVAAAVTDYVKGWDGLKTNKPLHEFRKHKRAAAETKQVMSLSTLNRLEQIAPLLPRVPEEYKCAICQIKSRDPRAVSYGGMFCKDCYDNIQNC